MLEHHVKSHCKVRGPRIASIRPGGFQSFFWFRLRNLYEEGSGFGCPGLMPSGCSAGRLGGGVVFPAAVFYCVSTVFDLAGASLQDRTERTVPSLQDGLSPYSDPELYVGRAGVETSTCSAPEDVLRPKFEEPENPSKALLSGSLDPRTCPSTDSLKQKTQQQA